MDVYFWDVSQPCRACFSSQNASHASGGVSAPNRHKSSSFNQIGKTGLGRVSISQGCTSKQRRRPMKPASSVGRPRKSFGNGSEDLDLEGNEPIDRDSYRMQVQCQNSCSSSKENLNASSSAATPRKDASSECTRFRIRSSMDVDNKGGKDPRVDGDDDNHDGDAHDDEDDDDNDDDGRDVGENEDDFGYN